MRVKTLRSRLICFGGAKACTNAADVGQDENDIGGPKFE
jgi:hypothetical protein